MGVHRYEADSVDAEGHSGVEEGKDGLKDERFGVDVAMALCGRYHSLSRLSDVFVLLFFSFVAGERDTISISISASRSSLYGSKERTGLTDQVGSVLSLHLEWIYATWWISVHRESILLSMIVAYSGS